MKNKSHIPSKIIDSSQSEAFETVDWKLGDKLIAINKDLLEDTIEFTCTKTCNVGGILSKWIRIPRERKPVNQ